MSCIGPFDLLFIIRNMIFVVCVCVCVQILRKSGPGLRESILLQLSQLVAITGPNIAPFLPSIFEILKDYWTEHLEYVLSIVQQIALTTSETFTQFLPMLLPLLLSHLSVPR